MIRPFLAALAALCLWPALTVHAACGGTDLRPGLDPAALSSAMGDMPFPQGNLWRAEKPDSVVHVVGTIHLDDPRLDPIAARLRPLIAGADRVLLEMTETEEAALNDAMGRDPGLLFLTDGPTLPDMLAEPDWQRLSQAARDRGIPAFMAAKMQPWYLSTLLSIPPCAMADLAAGGEGLDARVQDIAMAEGVPTAALEPYDTLFRLLGAEPMEDQIEVLLASLLPPRATEDMLATTVASYFDESHGEGWVAARLIARDLLDMPAAEVDVMFQEMTDILLVDRNRAWMPVILEAAEGSEIVVAAGAGHLHGTYGVLQGLADAGYTLTRLPF